MCSVESRRHCRKPKDLSDSAVLSGATPILRLDQGLEHLQPFPFADDQGTHVPPRVKVSEMLPPALGAPSRDLRFRTKVPGQDIRSKGGRIVPDSAGSPANCSVSLRTLDSPANAASRFHLYACLGQRRTEPWRRPLAWCSRP